MEPIAIVVRKKKNKEIEFFKRLHNYQKDKVSLLEIANILIKTYGDKDYFFEIDYQWWFDKKE